jgi:enoyl-CoA hydratase/carnithine racemase
MQMTLKELLMLTIDLLSRKVRRFVLDRKLAREYINRDYYRELIDEAQRGRRDTDRRIVMLEMQRRDI